MLITNDQLEAIRAGKLEYYSCDWCGHGILAEPGELILCPECRKLHLDPVGHGWDFGYGWAEDRRKFGLCYAIDSEDPHPATE